MNCSDLRTSLIRKINDEVETSIVAGQCVFTIPIKSLDDRYTEVFVENKLGDMYRVHDAGITTSHLYAQGIHMTEHKSEIFEEMARRLGVFYVRGAFEVSCKREQVDTAILAISQCAAIASFELASHGPVVEQEPIERRVERSLKHAELPYIELVQKGVVVKGKKARHIFNFVAFANESRFNSVAIQILHPSNSPQAQAERYGFLVLDSEGIEPYTSWKRLAVVTKVENWGDRSLSLVDQLSDQTIKLVTGQEEQAERFVPTLVRELCAA